MKFKLFGKSKKNEIIKLFAAGKYGALDSNLQLLLFNMQQKAKDGNFKDINLETKFEIERSMDGSKKTISITITQDQIKELVSYIEKLHNTKYLECAQNKIENIYNTLLTIQFFLQKEEDKDFVKEQTNNLKKYINLKEYKKKRLPAIMKSIDFIIEETKTRNKENSKSNESFITAIANIDKLSNNIKNYDDLIKKILDNSTISNNSTNWSDFENDIISTFEKCFNAISISIENNLIDSEIYTNTEYIKVIEKFIDIIPKEKQEKFIECLKTINIMRNKDCKDRKDRKLYIKKGENKIEIEFNSSRFIQDFKNKFLDLSKNIKTKHNRLYRILSEDKSLLLKNKILNITCNGRTYKGEGDVWDIENNYLDYNETYSSSPKSEKTNIKQGKQKIPTDSFTPTSHTSKFTKHDKTIIIKFKDLKSKKNFKKFYISEHEKKHHLNDLISSKAEREKFGILNIIYKGKTYVGKNNIWDKRNYSDMKPKQTQNYFSR